MSQTQTVGPCKGVVQGWSSRYAAHAVQGREPEPRAVHGRAMLGGGWQKGWDAGSDRCQGADEFTVFMVINQIRAGLRCPRSD